LTGEGSGKEGIHSHQPNPMVAALGSSLVTDFQSALLDIRCGRHVNASIQDCEA